jgi:ATP-binding cassette subfamily F protein 3
MIQLSNIFIKYGDRVLYNNINLRVEKGEKIGLVGRNGTGKSTLLKIIAGTQNPDDGIIELNKGVEVAFLTQDLPDYTSITLYDLAKSAFEKLNVIEDKINAINDKLEKGLIGESEEDLKIFDELAELNTNFDLQGGNNIEASIQTVLTGLGFRQNEFPNTMDTFSGGWIMRAELARLLLSNPDILLLDEPTNHLDIESIMWLEQYLAKSTMTIIVISHDKTFLSNVTGKTAEIEFGKLDVYKAPYNKYLQIKEERRAIQLSAYKNQQKQIAEKERTITRFMAKATKTKMAQSMKKQLDKLERIEAIDEEAATMKIFFPHSQRSGRIVLKGDNVSKTYGEKNVLDNISIEIEKGEKVAFVGQNGQGKTTLVKILIEKIKAEKGDISLGHNVDVSYYAQNQADNLDNKKTLLETMEAVSPPEMRTRLRSILGSFLFSGEDVDKKVSVLSGGERARLAMAMMILYPGNLLVLDEPTNHLDIQSKEILKQAVQQYEGTVLIVSHDRDFLAGLCEIVYEFRDKKIKKYLGDINYFLDKRAADNMREIEKATKSASASKSTVKEKPTVDREVLKKKRREMQYVERDIAKIEKEKESYEAKMADPSFFNQSNSQDEIAKYNELKSKLEVKLVEWEEVAEWLDTYDQ